MPLYRLLASLLLGPPPCGHLIEQCHVNASVQLVHVHSVKSNLETVIFGLMPCDCCLVLSQLVGMAFIKGLPNPLQKIGIKT